MSKQSEAIRYIEAIPPGSPVLIGGEVPATITAVTLRGTGHVTYEVSWWDGRSHNSEWMDEYEVRRSEQGEPLRFGFRP